MFAYRIHCMDFDALSEAGLISDQVPQFCPKCVREWVGKRRQQKSGVEILPSEVNSSMKGSDGFPCTCRPGNTGGTVEIAFHQLALSRVEKYRPFFPRSLESLFQLFPVIYQSESAFGIWVFKRCRGN